MLGNIVAVAVGGALGATGRYLIGLGVPALCAMLHIAGEFPLSTFVANFLGCFAIGVLSVLFDEGPWHNASSWRLFAITGILGGFTTFSTFSLETVALVERGAIGMAGLNVATSLVACLAGVALGRFVTAAACGARL